MLSEPTQLGLAGSVAPGKDIVLLLPSKDWYYSYVSAFYPEAGEFAGSSGMFFCGGYPHTVIPASAAVEPTIAHELTHAALAHLGLPVWLEEGVTQSMERTTTRAEYLMSTDDARRLRRFWLRHGLAGFWWGAGFHRPGPAQGHSYSLAEVLFRLMLDTYRPPLLGLFGGGRKRLVEFLRTARAPDAGQAAAVEHLGSTLGELAGRFLGPGEWEPDPTQATVIAPANDADERP